MQSFEFHFLHLLSDCVVAIASQAVDAGADKEVRANVLRYRTTRRCRSPGRQYARNAEGRRTAGLTASSSQASDSFPFLRSDPRGVDRLLERVAALELTACPKFDRSQTERHSLCRHGQTGMHQDAALGQRLAAHLGLAEESNVFWLISLIRKCRRILKDQDRPSRACEALPGCLKWPLKMSCSQT